MPIYFHRLENALKRANEFIDVGKKPRALEILCDVLRSRKHRTWQKKHEDIMIKYLELCVELKKSYVAKEGIYQYKIICQQTYIKSFEDVVRKYIEMAEEKANNAKEESKASVLDVDDLDNAQTPEDILLSAVSSEDTHDRTDRVVLIPWVKFLWESYRQCLDLLKNNSRTERLYHDIAHQAFRFCIKYNRKTEFRKLCDNLHAHLDILKKQMQNQQQQTHQQQNTVNLNNPESQAMHLETRLVQLDSAIQMELWQEAYKATDDIKRFGLMNLSKKPPKPQLMANYYQKLALVFWKAHCPLFHSAALFRLFHLSKELRKNITAEDVQKMASKVVAATLAIPIPPNRPEIDKLVDTEENVIENHQRNLSSLLGLTTNVPSRSSLIKDLKRMGVLQHAFQPLQELYRCLEVDFHPLVLCGRVQQVIDFIEKCNECPELKQYINALKDVTIMRLLKEVSQVYQTIEFSRLLELCPFANYTRLEKMVVEAARRNDLQVRIDHRKGCLIFGTELRVSHGEELIEGPHLQSMPSEQIRRQLVNMYSTLHKAKLLIEPDRLKTNRDELKRKIMSAYRMTAVEDHRRLLSRQGIIESRKEELEQLGIKREEEERRVLEEKQQRLREAEEGRLKVENEEREKQMKLRRDLEIKKQMAMDQISSIKGFDNLDDDELAKLKPEDIQSRRIEQLEKERRDQLAKQRKLERKVDHVERAKRIEEIPLLVEAFNEWRIKDEDEWKILEEERIKDIKAERALALQHRERFLRMSDDKDVFAAKIKNERHSLFMEELSKFQEKLNEERAKRLEARKIKRKEENRINYFKAIEEENKRKKYEAERKKKEEIDASLAKIEEKKRQREREIEEKMLQKNKEAEERLRDDDDRPKRDDQRMVQPERDHGRKVPERTRPGIDDSWRRKEETEPEKDNWRNKQPITVSESTPTDPEKPAPWRPKIRTFDEPQRENPIRRDLNREEKDKDAPKERFDRDRAPDREIRRETRPRQEDERSWRDNDNRRDDIRRDDNRRDDNRRDDIRRDDNRRDDIRRDDNRRDDIRRDDNRRDDNRRDDIRRDDNRRERDSNDSAQNWRERSGANDYEDDRRQRPRTDFNRGDRDRGMRSNFAKDDRGPRSDYRDDRGPRKDRDEPRGPRDVQRDRDDRRGPQSSRSDEAQDWRREGPKSDDKRGDDNWRSAPKDQNRDRIQQNRGPPKKGFDDRRDKDPSAEDDGWTTVRSRR